MPSYKGFVLTMKVVILAGGYGTRLGEETRVIPKPMVQIGEHPILWHIMKLYSHYGFDEFVILTGYLSHVIKNFFVTYYERYSDLTVDMKHNTVEMHKVRTEPWKVSMLYTGEGTMTGGRIARARQYIGKEPFMLTYGDGVANVDINKLLAFHRCSGKLCTCTAVQVAGRFGSLAIGADGAVAGFAEKPMDDSSWINGGFFVCEPGLFDYIGSGDNVVFECEPLEKLAAAGQLSAYKHRGFWQCMDTQRDKAMLNSMWERGKAPWKVWE